MQKNTKKTETVEREYLVEVTCDRCGQKSDSENWSNSDNSYDFDEVKVERRHGTSYPEGGDTEVHTFDLCPDCFVALSEWIGAKPRITNLDY